MIYLASDHAGFELKKTILAYLKSTGREVTDMGPFEYNKDDDYPDYVYPCALKVAEGQPADRGIILGWSGNGEAIAANKVKGVRAAVYYGGNQELVCLSRDHNDANVLSLGAGFIAAEEIKQAIDLWLQTAFGGGRHRRRIEKIQALEQQNFK